MKVKQVMSVKAVKAVVGKLDHIISWILRSSLIVVILKSIVDQQWWMLFLSALALFLMFLPKMLMRKFWKSPQYLSIE